MNRGGLEIADRLLAHFGIAEQAESLWHCLLADPQVTLERLKTESGLTGPEVDQAIAALHDASLVRRASAPSGMAVIDPSLALGSHLARAERKLAEQAEEFAALRAALPKVTSQFNQGRREAGRLPGFEVVSTLDEIQRQVALAAHTVNEHLRSLEHNRVREVSRDCLEDNFELIGRGVRDRAIIRTGAMSDPATWAYFRDLQKHGHDARSLPDIATRLLIFDTDLAVMPVDPTNLALGAIFIRVRSVIDALILMYDHMWSIATPIFTTAPTSDVPSGRTAQVLEQLGVGSKDDAIARVLGTSVRTIKREVANLKTTLGVQSRGELVAAAVRKGWL